MSVPRKKDADLSVPLAANGNRRGFGDGYRFAYHQHGQRSNGFSWGHGFASDHDAQQTLRDTEHTLPATPEQLADRADAADPRAVERLTFLATVALRYHQRRQQHYDRVFRTAMLGMLGLGGLVLASGLHHVALMGTAIIGMAATVLIWNVNGKARLHDVLHHDYHSLLNEMTNKSHATPDDLQSWQRRHTRIQLREPPVYWALANDCTFDLARQWGMQPAGRGAEGAQGVWQRLLMHWFRF